MGFYDNLNTPVPQLVTGANLNQAMDDYSKAYNRMFGTGAGGVLDFIGNQQEEIRKNNTQRFQNVLKGLTPQDLEQFNAMGINPYTDLPGMLGINNGVLMDTQKAYDASTVAGDNLSTYNNSQLNAYAQDLTDADWAEGIKKYGSAGNFLKDYAQSQGMRIYDPGKFNQTAAPGMKKGIDFISQQVANNDRRGIGEIAKDPYLGLDGLPENVREQVAQARRKQAREDLTKQAANWIKDYQTMHPGTSQEEAVAKSPFAQYADFINWGSAFSTDVSDKGTTQNRMDRNTESSTTRKINYANDADVSKSIYESEKYQQLVAQGVPAAEAYARLKKENEDAASSTFNEQVSQKLIEMGVAKDKAKSLASDWTLNYRKNQTDERLYDDVAQSKAVLEITENNYKTDTYNALKEAGIPEAAAQAILAEHMYNTKKHKVDAKWYASSTRAQKLKEIAENLNGYTEEWFKKKLGVPKEQALASLNKAIADSEKHKTSFLEEQEKGAVIKGRDALGYVAQKSKEDVATSSATTSAQEASKADSDFKKNVTELRRQTGGTWLDAMAGNSKSQAAIDTNTETSEKSKSNVELLKRIKSLGGIEQAAQAQVAKDKEAYIKSELEAYKNSAEFKALKTWDEQQDGIRKRTQAIQAEWEKNLAENSYNARKNEYLSAVEWGKTHNFSASIEAAKYAEEQKAGLTEAENKRRTAGIAKRALDVMEQHDIGGAQGKAAAIRAKTDADTAYTEAMSTKDKLAETQKQVETSAKRRNHEQKIDTSIKELTHNAPDLEAYRNNGNLKKFIKDAFDTDSMSYTDIVKKLSENAGFVKHLTDIGSDTFNKMVKDPQWDRAVDEIHKGNIGELQNLMNTTVAKLTHELNDSSIPPELRNHIMQGFHAALSSEPRLLGSTARNAVNTQLTKAQRSLESKRDNQLTTYSGAIDSFMKRVKNNENMNPFELAGYKLDDKAAQEKIVAEVKHRFSKVKIGESTYNFEGLGEAGQNFLVYATLKSIHSMPGATMKDITDEIMDTISTSISTNTKLANEVQVLFGAAQDFDTLHNAKLMQRMTESTLRDMERGSNERPQKKE